MDNNKIKKVVALCILIGLALFSFFVLSKKMSDIETYRSIITTLDEKKATVMGLSAASTTIANAISLIPGDIGMPIANQFTDLSSWLVLVLIVLYLEKYLLTIVGLIVFKYVLPLVLIVFGVNIFIKNQSLNQFLIKIVLVCTILMLIVPTSTKISQMIDQTYEDNVKIKIDEIINTDIENEEVEEEIIVEEEKKAEDQKWYEKVGSFFVQSYESTKEAVSNAAEGLSNGSKNLIAKAKATLNNFIEGTVVMVVTTCVVPIFTLIVLLFFMKALLGVDIKLARPKISTVKGLVKKYEEQQG